MKKGSNELHGGLFSTYEGNSVDANQWQTDLRYDPTDSGKKKGWPGSGFPALSAQGDTYTISVGRDARRSTAERQAFSLAALLPRSFPLTYSSFLGFGPNRWRGQPEYKNQTTLAGPFGLPITQ